MVAGHSTPAAASIPAAAAMAAKAAMAAVAVVVVVAGPIANPVPGMTNRRRRPHQARARHSVGVVRWHAAAAVSGRPRTALRKPGPRWWSAAATAAVPGGGSAKAGPRPRDHPQQMATLRFQPAARNRPPQLAVPPSARAGPRPAPRCRLAGARSAAGRPPCLSSRCCAPVRFRWYVRGHRVRLLAAARATAAAIIAMLAPVTAKTVARARTLPGSGCGGPLIGVPSADKGFPSAGVS